ncbi:hypothetical protein FRB90_005443 [Tulasnella sp. 427]|nr:hypothetical protein FRB90_005443 [Tulasnella sp. 427]
MQVSKATRLLRLCQATISSRPNIETQPSTQTWKYSPPAGAMPTFSFNPSVELVFDPTIPKALTGSLYRYLALLPEDRIDEVALSRAEALVRSTFPVTSEMDISNESTVLNVFAPVIMNPLKLVCRALGFTAVYKQGPRFKNLNPDHAWFANDKRICIFEHKSPTVLEFHTPEILNLAAQGETLDLEQPAHNGASIIAKAVLPSLADKLDFCVIHSGDSYIVVHLVPKTKNGRWQARISDAIPLISEDTPVLGLMVSLILHSRKDGEALRYQPLNAKGLVSSILDSQQPFDASPHASVPGKDEPTGRQGASSSEDRFQGGRTAASGAPEFLEYWEPKDVLFATLKALLESMNTLSLQWDMEMFTNDIFRPMRRDDSTIWADLAVTHETPRLIQVATNHHGATPPPSPPMTPFILRLHSNISNSAIGTAFEGQFAGLSLPLVTKVLPAEAMDAEVEIWKKLRHLAGMSIPGLLGAYVLEKGDEVTGALVQQHVGQAIASFNSLTSEQKCELYRIVVQIHKAGVEHGDVGPENVTLRSDGKVFVVDFSDAKLHECPEESNCEELRNLRCDLYLPVDYRVAVKTHPVDAPMLQGN